jgi:hypothetical protein
MAEPSPMLRVSPFCADLRTKKAYFLSAPALTEEDLLDASGRAWCRRTMQAVGPDGELVLPLECRHGRACFKSQMPDA